MNRLSNYFLLLFMSATVLFVSSCGEDDEPIFNSDATIEFEDADGNDFSDTTLAPGAPFTFFINVDFDEEQAPLNLIVEDQDGNEIGTTRPLNTDPIQTLQTNYDVPEDTSGTVVLTAFLEDSDGITVVSEDLSIDVISVTAFTTYSTIMVAAPTEDETSDSFFSSSTGELYSFSDVVSTADPISEDIDFGYFYGDALNATISSPDEWPDDASLYNGLERWGTRNNTDFRGTSFTSEDFDAVTNGTGLVSEFEGNSGNELEGRASNLSEGDVIAFATADDRFGLIEVVSITGTDGSNGEISINVKVTE